MRHFHHFEPSDGIVYAMATGDFEITEFGRMLDSLNSENGFTEGVSLLVDLSECDIPSEPAAIRALYELTSQNSFPRIPSVALVVDFPIWDVIESAFREDSQNERVAFFRSKLDALAFLDVSWPQFA